MIKVLLHLFSDTCVANTDGTPEILIKSFLDCRGVVLLKCPAETFQFLDILHRFLLKPLPNLLHKNPSYLPVRNDKLCQVTRLGATPGQISCRKQYAPQILDACVQIPVGQFLPDPLFYTPAVYQQFDFIAGRCFRPADKPSDDIVPARVHPVILRYHCRLHFERMTVTNHIPRTIYVQCAKTIAVIPLLYGFIFIHKPVVFQHLSDLRVCKAKKFVILDIRHCVHAEIIESGKYALL